jgi:sarcosine oxidase subunit beta
MRNVETVIIGGGVVGASVAYHLALRDAKGVLVLEREECQGLGSTGKATGGVRAQFETDINIRMSLYSLDFFKECGFDCAYEPRGYLFFATTPEQMEYLAGNVAKQRALGVRDVELVAPQAVSEIVPGINCEDIVGGSFGKHDGFIDPLAVMRGFTADAVQNGAAIEFGVDVHGIRVEKGRIAGVDTAHGTIGCENVVLCTGAAARSLASTAGVDLPVEPQRRQIVWARTAVPLPTSLPMVIDIGTGFHFRPARDFSQTSPTAPRTSARCSEVLFAFPDPDEPPSENCDFDEEFIAKVYERAMHRAEFLGSSQVIREKCRAGLYENTPDHHAILGGCEIEGLYFANGFSGHGVMHSPATGRALSEIILDGRSNFLDVSCLSLERFAKGKMLHETAFI